MMSFFTNWQCMIRKLFAEIFSPPEEQRAGANRRCDPCWPCCCRLWPRRPTACHRAVATSFCSNDACLRQQRRAHVPYTRRPQASPSAPYTTDNTAPDSVS